MKQLFFNIIDKLFSVIFWTVEFYCVNNNKVKKAKEWISNYLNEKYKKENIKITYVDHIETRGDKEVIGRYNIKEKTIKLKKLYYDYPCFRKELTALHELGHHYLRKYRGGSEIQADQMVLVSIKTDFPKWIIQTMIIGISTYFDKDYDYIWKFFNLSFLDIKLSEWKNK